ncbi:MAG: thiamine monophosphate synthase [Alphaproteobacteria bacterium]|nr:MAG: thiamine monophosphate synthase [Alphaproteobacteria bacterium]
MLPVMTLTDIAKRLNQDHGQGENLPPVFFITDSQAVADPEKVISALPAGSAVILRDYDYPAREKLGADLRALCRERMIVFLVAGDAGLASKLSADGVHLPEGLMGRATDIRAAHGHWMITVSCHDLVSVRRAKKLPIDAGLIAPVFPTLSHPETLSGTRPILGLSGLRHIVAATALPLYALGGVTANNAGQLVGSGVAGIAAIRGFEQS